MVIATAAPAAAQTTGPRLQYGVIVSKDTVTVGEHFDVRVRVRVPPDASIRFPENPDTAGAVQARDPRAIVTTDSVAALDETATYHVAAWDIGEQRILLDDVVVTWRNSDRAVALGDVRVFVRSLLPADSALRVPKPARALWEPRAFPWWIVALALAALVIGWSIWWWMRRRRQPRPVAAVDPYVRARKEFARIEAMQLLEADERTRFAALNVEVLRDYFAARYPRAALALTSRELVAAVRAEPLIPIERLSRALHEADLAKFAAWTLSEERARGLGRDAREIVEEEHEAAAAAAAAADAASAKPDRAA